MRATLAAALLAGAVLAHAQAPSAKKELVAKLLQMQQSGIEAMSRALVERPASQMLQEAGRIVQTRVAADKRDGVGKSIEASVKKYVDEAAPLLRERAVRLAPSTLGAALEEKFSEEELRQLIAWLDSPLNKKYTQVGPQMQNEFVRKLMAEAGPLIDPKLQALNENIGNALRAGVDAGAAGAAAKPAAPASAAASK
jgi:uncharacterized protein